MRRGTTAMAPSPLPGESWGQTRPHAIGLLAPSPLAGEGGGEGQKVPLSPLCPYTHGVMPVLSGPMRSEILHFVQNDNGRGG